MKGNLETASLCGWKTAVYIPEGGKEKIPLLYILGGKNIKEELADLAVLWEKTESEKVFPFLLAGLGASDWNSAYSPWAGAAAYTGRRRICRACLRDRPVSYKGISSLCVSALSGLREERKPRCGGIFPWWSWGSLSVFGNGGVCRSGQLFRFPVVSGLVQVYGKSFFAERAGVCISFPGQGREKDPFPSDGPQSRVHGKNQRSAFPTDGDGFASRFSME